MATSTNSASWVRLKRKGTVPVLWSIFIRGLNDVLTHSISNSSDVLMYLMLAAPLISFNGHYDLKSWSTVSNYLMSMTHRFSKENKRCAVQTGASPEDCWQEQTGISDRKIKICIRKMYREDFWRQRSEGTAGGNSVGEREREREGRVRMHLLQGSGVEQMCPCPSSRPVRPSRARPLTEQTGWKNG